MASNNYDVGNGTFKPYYKGIAIAFIVIEIIKIFFAVLALGRGRILLRGKISYYLVT